MARLKEKGAVGCTEVPRRLVSKKGGVQSVSLLDTSSLEASYSRDAGSLVPPPNKLRSLRAEIKRRIDELATDGRLSAEQRNEIRAAWNGFEEDYIKALDDFLSYGLHGEAVLKQAESFGTLLRTLSEHARGDVCRAKLVSEVLSIGTVRLSGADRFVVGVDYFQPAADAAQRAHGAAEVISFVTADGARCGLATGCADAVCSSHIIEHFTDPTGHVAELARLTASDGTAYILTPNKPADFENPYHVYLFEPDDLAAMLSEAFDEVTVLGMDASQSVKDDFAARRATGNKILKLDFMDLRHKIPHNWYVKGYELGLKVVYRVLGDRYSGGTTGITDADFFIADDIDPSTPVLFAIARKPKRQP
jgi:SAM-dependent methyltransferase